MATMIDEQPGFAGEKRVWSILEKGLSKNVIVYNHREIEGKEFDFCLLIPGKGMLVLEEKGWNPVDVKVVGHNRIEVKGLGEVYSPKSQSRGYRFNLLNNLKQNLGISPFVGDLVCFSEVTEEDFVNTGLNLILERQSVLLKPDLEDADTLNRRINEVFHNDQVLGSDLMDETSYGKIRKYFEPGFSLAEAEPSEKGNLLYSHLQVFGHTADQYGLRVLMDSYKKGTKLILFFADSDSLELFIKVINAWQEKNSVQLKSNKAEILERTLIHHVQGSADNLRLFNIEAYVLPEAIKNQIRPVIIEDGKMDSDQEEVLQRISEIVPFNLTQYLIEHQSPDTNIQIKAGAGTGKTYSMISRVSFLSFGKDPYLSNLEMDLGMITFTNEAADTMRKRLIDHFLNYFRVTSNPVYLQKIRQITNARIMTIHKFCLELIRSEASRAGLGNNFSIGSNQYLRRTLYDKYFDEYLKRKYEDNPNYAWNLAVPNYSIRSLLMDLADRLLSKNIALESITRSSLGTELAATVPDFNGLILEVLVPAEREYSQELHSYDQIELNRLVSEANHILERGDVIETGLKCLFVDEFQDTDDSQISLLEKLCQNLEKRIPLFVVGDLKQSIYRFRGATMSAFDQLRRFIKDWKTFSLNLNYRSDFELLEEMNRSFMKMASGDRLPYGSDDHLIGVKRRDDNQSMLCVEYADDQQVDAVIDTAEQCKTKLQEELEHKSLSSEERTIAILVRTNADVRKITEAAASRGVFINSSQTDGLFQSRAAIDMSKLIRALANSGDAEVLADFLSSDFFGKPLNYGEIAGLSYTDKLLVLNQTLNANLSERTDQSWDTWKKRVYSEPVLSLLHDFFGQMQPWKSASTDLDVQNQYRFIYDQLIEHLQKQWRLGALNISDVQDFLEFNLFRSTMVPVRELKKEDDVKEIQIVCMTVHKSKGLEFGTVLLPFMDRKQSSGKSQELEVDLNSQGLGYYIKRNEYGNAISQSNSVFSVENEVIEMRSEEVRILYVAMTRAIHKLIWFTNPDKDGSGTLSDYLQEESND